MAGTIPSSGPISMSDITGVFGKDAPDDELSEYYRGGKFVPGYNDTIPSSGEISFGDFRDGRVQDAAATEWTPGTYTVRIPDWSDHLTFELWGPGGGPMGGNDANATTLEATPHTITAGGGKAGTYVAEAQAAQSPSGGIGGATTYGDAGSANGFQGEMGAIYTRGAGGKNGQGNGIPAWGGGATPPFAFNAHNTWFLPGGGGGGAYAIKTWTAADLAAGTAPAPGSDIVLKVAVNGGGDAKDGHAKMSFQ